MTRCNDCIHKKTCIDGANFENAKQCKNYVKEQETMTTKEYLNQAYNLDRKANMILQKADAMRKSLYSRGQSYENNGHGNNDDSIAKAVVKVVEYEYKASKIINNLIDKRIEIENVIALVLDPIQREVLERRYLLYQNWDGYYDKMTGQYVKGIYEMMGCSRRQMFRYHTEGIKSIEKYGTECH